MGTNDWVLPILCDNLHGAGTWRWRASLACVFKLGHCPCLKLLGPHLNFVVYFGSPMCVH